MDAARTQRGPCAWTSRGSKLYKGPGSQSFQLGGHPVSVATTHLCCYSEKAAQGTCERTAELGSDTTLFTEEGWVWPAGRRAGTSSVLIKFSLGYKITIKRVHAWPWACFCKSPWAQKVLSGSLLKEHNIIAKYFEFLQIHPKLDTVRVFQVVVNMKN